MVVFIRALERVVLRETDPVRKVVGRGDEKAVIAWATEPALAGTVLGADAAAVGVGGVEKEDLGVGGEREKE